MVRALKERVAPIEVWLDAFTEMGERRRVEGKFWERRLMGTKLVLYVYSHEEEYVLATDDGYSQLVVLRLATRLFPRDSPNVALSLRSSLSFNTINIPSHSPRHASVRLITSAPPN